jgi:hypothetical protein
VNKSIGEYFALGKDFLERTKITLTPSVYEGHCLYKESIVTRRRFELYASSGIRRSDVRRRSVRKFPTAKDASGRLMSVYAGFMTRASRNGCRL